MFEGGIIEGKNKRASRELPILADPDHITVDRLRRHDYPHFIIESNTITFSHSGGSIMAARIPESEYHVLARDRGLEFVGPYTGRISDPVNWRCSEGHELNSPFRNVVRASGCPYCLGVAQRQEGDYHALAKERGFEFLGPYTGRVRDRTSWRCEQGHEWRASYDNIKRNGCPECSHTRLKTGEDYHTLAKETGTVWLGTRSPGNVREKTKWGCAHGHTWLATYHSRNQDNGCPECYRKNNRGENNPNWNPDLTEEDRNHSRGYAAYQVWRNAVLERDGNACQICGVGEGKIVAHHIYSYGEYPEYQTDTRNGITMCENCHREYHHIYGIKAYPLDFLDFLSKKGVRIAN